MKPVVDFVLAAVLLLALIPVLVAIALTIKLTMGAPVIFRQQRVGRDGQLFTVYKFRTMIPDRRSRASTGYDKPDRRRTHKTANDPRVTRVGRGLRKSSLDELPQLFNVLKGEMSVVGPRPELSDIVSRYEAWQHRRHVVKPGITGLWQTRARGDGAMHEHVDIDLAYIERLSLRTDAAIVLRTLPTVLKMGGY